LSVKQETRSGGYCETCYYEEEVWVVYVNGKSVHTFDSDLASILNEILE